MNPFMCINTRYNLLEIMSRISRDNEGEVDFQN